MVCTRKLRQQNKKFFSRLDESDADFKIGRSNHEAQAGIRTNMVDIGISLNNTNCPIQANSTQVDMHILEENIVSKVQNEVDNVMTTVKTRIQDAVLTAIECLVIPRVELARNQPMRHHDGVLTVMYWNLIRWIFWVKLKTYK